MNNAMHDQLNKLRLIGKLQVGQSLDTSNGLSVYEFGYLNWVWRKWNRDNKEEVTRYLQEFYRSVDQSVEQLISDIKNTKDENKKKKLLHTATNLAEKLKASIGGIENLSKTYSAYTRTYTMLEGIVQDFAISIYVQLIEILPATYLTKSLKENVLYNGIILHRGLNDIRELEKKDSNNEQHLDKDMDDI